MAHAKWLTRRMHRFTLIGSALVLVALLTATPALAETSSWQKVDAGVGIGNSINHVYSQSQGRLWAVGGYYEENTGKGVSTILLSETGGQDWTKQVLDGVQYPLNAVAFSDPTDGVAVGNGGMIIQTTNSGANWIHRGFANNTTGRYYEVAFADDLHGWIVGTRPRYNPDEPNANSPILKTNDGGATWFQQQTPCDGYYGLELSGLEVLDEKNAYAVGYYSETVNTELHGAVILSTHDGGNTWTKWSVQALPNTNISFEAVSFGDATHGCAVGNETYGEGEVIYTTADGGVTWTRRRSSDAPARAALMDVDFIDANQGWAAGGSAIVATTDGGVTWTTQPWPSPNWYLRSITFSSPKLGWAVGDNGTVLKTIDGGFPPAVTHTVTAVIDSVLPNPVATFVWATLTGHGTDSGGHTITGYEWTQGTNVLNGAATFRARALAEGAYTMSLRVRCSEGTWSPVVSQVLTVTKSACSLTAPKVSGTASARRGTKLIGSVSPGHSTKVTVEIRRYAGGSYRAYKKYSVSTGSSGTWGFTSKPKKGTYSVRAYLAADTGHGAGSSAWRKVIVR